MSKDAIHGIKMISLPRRVCDMEVRSKELSGIAYQLHEALPPFALTRFDYRPAQSHWSQAGHVL